MGKLISVLIFRYWKTCFSLTVKDSVAKFAASLFVYLLCFC